MKLIIDGYNKTLRKKDNQIVVMEKDNEIYRISANKVSDITIMAKGHITFDALNLMAKNNIKLISINYFGQINYILESPNQNNIVLKKLQYQASENHKGLLISKEFIKSKMKNQKSTIKTLNKNKKIKEVKIIENKIKQNIKDFKNFKITLNDNIFTSKNKIMGFEGIASVNYWEAVSLLLPDEINFKNRNQKPENDVVNSMLNYGYAILASEIAKNIVTLGLDPYCGLLHADLKRRQSLIFDLIEEFRQQIVDKTVFKLINTNQINETNIDKRNNSLKLESRKLLAGEIMAKIHSDLTFENEKVTYAKIIENQTKKLVKSLLNNTEYSGFYLNW